jgi:drug/metabolite transporter (DMT)-like permease
VRQLLVLAAGFGVVAAVFLALDIGPVGQVLAMIQLGVVVGAPLAMLLHHELRSWPVVIVVGIGLSIALTSLAAQSLIWFDLAGPEMLVILATGYGVALAWLLSTADLGREPDVTPQADGDDGR